MRPWPSDAQDLAEALTAQGRASTFDLDPLGPGAASAVLADAADRELTRHECDNALGACAGNPFLLSQSGVSLRSRDGGAGTSGGRDGRLLVSRFGGLPADVLHIAQVASVVGTRFRPSLVAAAAEVELRRVALAIRALVAAGLVRELGGGQVEFVHPLFAQALYDDLPGTTRGQLHGQVMRALVATGAEPAQGAAHARAGHLLGDPDAITVLEAAGRAALAAGGLESALVELRAAADLAGATAPPSLLVTLADTEVAAGNPERAETLCNLLLAAAPEASVRAQVLSVLGRAALATGRTDQFQKCFQTAAVAAHQDPSLEVAVLGEAVAASSVLSNPRQVLTWAEQARRILDEHPGLDRVATDAAWAVTACLTGDPSGAAAVLDALADGRLVSAIASGPPTLAVWTAVAAYHVAMMVERFAESREPFEAGWARAQKVGAPMLITYMGIGYVDVQCRQGRLAEARQLIGSMEDANAELGSGMSVVARLPKAVVALETGDSAGASAECDLLAGTLLHNYPQYYPFFRIWLSKLRAEMALDAGRTDEAGSGADAMRGLAAEAGIVEPCAVPWADTAVAAYLRAGRLDDVEELIRHLDTVSAGWPCRWPRSVAESGRAGLAEARNDYLGAEKHHHLAISLLEEVDLPLALVRALIGYGIFLRRTGRPAQSRAPLGRAVENAHTCGATRLEDQALVQLRASGGRRGRGRGPELSSQEQRTATLAAQGATNAEIAAALAVSVKTVEHYLSSTYAKLGISSRHELPKVDPVSG